MATARSRVVATGFPVKRRGSAAAEKSMGAWRRARMRGERLVRLRTAGVVPGRRKSDCSFHDVWVPGRRDL